MIKFNEIAQYQTYLNVEGKLTDNVIKLCTDSRSYKNESAFLAITGEKFNAFEFIAELVDQGCCNIIYSKHPANTTLFEKYKQQYPNVNFIQVSCSIRFLQEHANNISVKFQAAGNKLICISGSNGKTTTKEMLYHLLQRNGCNVIKTQKNNNNHIGVPLTILQIDEKTEYAVIELGSNHPGEIHKLCEIADPCMGVVTNIGFTHMEFFPSINDVFVEEGFLYHYIMAKKSPNKLFFLNCDDDLLKNLECTESCVKFGENHELNHGEFQFDVDSQSAKIMYQGASYEVINSNITGKHNFYNLCVSITIAAKVSGMDIQKLCDAAQEFKPTANRSEWIEINECKIFLDAYNANPSSMEVAVTGFRDFLTKNSIDLTTACVILGDMNELGSQSSAYHERLGRFVTEQQFGGMFFVGRYAESYANGISDLSKIKTFNSTNDLIKIFQSDLVKDYKYIFIKGSRSLQLEALVAIT